MNIDRKTQIVQTAAKLFHDKGYNAVSMRDLADNLGIRAASLYNHISSKQEILAIIVMDVARSFTSHMAQTATSDLTTTEKLEEIIRMHVQITMQKTDALACMNDDWKQLDEEHRKAYIAMRDGYEDEFRKIILQGIQSGELKDRHPEILIFNMLSTLRTLYLWYSKHKRFNQETLQENLQKDLLYGVVNS